MLDLLVKNATFPDGRTGMCVAVQDGRIVEAAAGLDYPATEVLDAQGQLLSPPFVDAHFHMDATLSYGLPRVNQSGTLLEGIALWGELKPLLTQDALIARALQYCDWAAAKGLLAIRTHVDVCDPRLLAVEALLEVKKQVASYIDLQLVAFPQDGVLRGPQGADQHLHNLLRALDLGVDVVGGIPHFERTMADGAASVRLLCELAATVAFRARLFNIGAEGQLYAGALAAVAVGGAHGGTGWDLPPALLFGLMLAASALAGALLLLGPALMKARLGVDEVVTTLLLNFIVLLLVSMMLDGPMKDPTAMGWPQSVALLPELELSKLIAQTRVHSGLLAGMGLALGLWVLMRYTVLGFDIRALGANAGAAAFVGVPVTRTLVWVAVLSGGLAGLAGAIEVAGQHRDHDTAIAIARRHVQRQVTGATGHFDGAGKPRQPAREQSHQHHRARHRHTRKGCGLGIGTHRADIKTQHRQITMVRHKKTAQQLHQRRFARSIGA